MTWRIDDPQGNEAGKIKHLIVPYTRGQGLDLGCGPWKAYPHFISVDNFDEWRGLEWAPDVRGDCTDLSMFADASLDFVFSSHLLEHLDNTEAALAAWWRVIKPGGHLVLYLPHKHHYPNIGEHGANPDHRHDFLPEDIIGHMERVGGWDLVRNQTRVQDCEYSFFQVYRKGKGKHHKHSWKSQEATEDSAPRCLVIRYGGIGDMIMASSILPGLKKQGFHVTLNTTPRGHEIIRADPHIDDFLLQDIDQVPNAELGSYWQALGNEFDHVVNLCESIEGALLALPDRRNFALPPDARDMVMNVNYLEFTHKIAGVPFPLQQKFYPTGIEAGRARAFRRSLGPGPVILWALSGSAVHKAWPWTDNVVVWLLEQHPNARIILCGDPRSQVLEMAIIQKLAEKFLGLDAETSDGMKLSELLGLLKTHWGGENKVICTSGAWSIRDTLSIAREVDMVVGPETGVLNAVGLEEVAKVLMLSHSSAENLTKHWVNTITIQPTAGCHPCHRMHYGWEYCPQDEKTGAAECASSIEPQRVFNAITVRLSSQAPAPRLIAASS
ncbi:MAG: methyltransferase domain-containing protein [Paracoccaceae bacterium]|nr:methyltransferase domain-containing protein [Paracoccaceae bacterium]